MSENKSSGYLEGNYDGKNMVSLAGQIAADIAESIVISQEAEKEQEKAKEKETKRILGKESVTEEDIDKILEDYATNEEYKQYLMDGAVLQCNQATLDPFILPDGTKIDLVLNANENGEERKQTNLCVLDKSMSANDTPYATVLDTKQEENIFPFRCHCKRGVDREEEYSKIKNDPSCKIDGVCKHLMKLSKEWDNLPLDGQLYKKRDVTIEIMDDLNLIMKDTQCINMMSMLFCKHGGLITPVTSGQKNVQVNYSYENIIDKATVDRIKTLHPSIRQQAINFIVSVQKIYPDIRISQGYRTIEEQNALYNQGRDGNGGTIVTNAKGGSSYHNYGLALDIVRIIDNAVSYDIDWEKLEKIGSENGFEWGGNWTSIDDKPHFQISFGYSTSELYQLYMEGKVESGYVILE